jgi:chromosome segregation ATPase
MKWHSLAFCSVALLTTAVQAEVYTCTTANGRKITSDRPIAECADREQRELETTTGRITIIKPKQTEAERYAEREAQKQVLREKESALQQQRRDQQLLARYPDDAALEEKRSYLLEEIKKRWAPTLEEQAKINARRQELNTQALARRKANKAPDYDSIKEAAQLERRMLQLQPMLDKFNYEIEETNRNMDADLARLRQIRQQTQAARAVALGQPQQQPSPSASANTPSPAAKPAQSPSH